MVASWVATSLGSVGEVATVEGFIMGDILGNGEMGLDSFLACLPHLGG